MKNKVYKKGTTKYLALATQNTWIDYALIYL